MVLIDRLLLQDGFADVEDMAGVHPVNAVQLDIFRRVCKNVLHRPFGFGHFLQQLQEIGRGRRVPLSGFSHGKAGGESSYG